jgi:hypothetical protein
MLSLSQCVDPDSLNLDPDSAIEVNPDPGFRMTKNLKSIQLKKEFFF